MTDVVIAPVPEGPGCRLGLNLADSSLGAEVLEVTDEFCTPGANVAPGPAAFYPDRYDDHGKWMDGWKPAGWTTGHDWCIVRLAMQGY